MITRQSLKNLKRRPTHRNAPRRRVHKIGKHIQLVTYGGIVTEKRVWDGHAWIEVSDTNMEYLLLKEIFRLKSRVRALSKGKRK